MEMLIVVAIIAILIAIAIPAFSKTLHRARVVSDWANVRSYYAALMTEYLSTGELDPNIPGEPGNFKKDITFPDGSKVTLKAGSYCVIWVRATPTQERGEYQIYYYCDQWTHPECTLSLGASQSR